jgi:hypothetical protein
MTAQERRLLARPSNTNVVQLPGTEIESLTECDVLIGISHVRDAADSAVFIREVSVPGDLSPILGSVNLESAQSESILGLLFLDSKIGQKQAQSYLTDGIGDLPCDEQFPPVGMGLFSPNPTTEYVSEELDGLTVCHSNLNGDSVTRVHSAGQVLVRLRFRYSDATLAVNDTGAVSNVQISSHVVSPSTCYVIIPGRR